MMIQRKTRSRRLLTALAALVGGFVLLPAASQPAAAQNKWSKVVIATEGAYAPWNFTSAGGKIEGFEVDLAQNLCGRMKVTCEVIAQDWDGIIPALQARKYDAIMAGMNITPKRLEVIDFAGPYAGGPHGFGVLKGSKFATLPGGGSLFSLATQGPAAKPAIDALRAALKGATVGVQVSTTNANFLEKFFKDVVTIQEYKTTEQHDLDLSAGRVDAIFAAHSAIIATAEKPEFKDVQVVGAGFSGDVLGSGVGVGLRKGDPELKAMFEEAIKAALADGTVKNLSMKWFKTDMSPL